MPTRKIYKNFYLFSNFIFDLHIKLRLKKKKYVSKFVIEWKTNAACSFYFLFFIFFLIVSRSVKFESVITFVQSENMKLDFG